MCVKTGWKIFDRRRNILLLQRFFTPRSPSPRKSEIIGFTRLASLCKRGSVHRHRHSSFFNCERFLISDHRYITTTLCEGVTVDEDDKYFTKRTTRTIIHYILLELQLLQAPRNSRNLLMRQSSSSLSHYTAVGRVRPTTQSTKRPETDLTL